MGLPFVVALEQDIGVHCDIEPSLFLGSSKKEMFEIASRQGVTHLNCFCSSSLEDQAKFAKIYGYTSENNPEQWFDASEGLRSIRAFLTYLRNEAVPYELHSITPNVNELVQALIQAFEATEAVLEAAHQQNVRFHFAALP